MGAYPLCGDCAARFKNPPFISKAAQPEGCFICNGALLGMGSLVESAVRQSFSFEWGSFSVSSSFPRSLLVREQVLAQRLAPGQFTSIKNSVNAALASLISEKSGHAQDQRNPDAQFEFSFIEGKAAAKPAPLFIFGHYLKLSRKHCQSNWHCSECGGKGTRAAGSGAGACASCGGSGMNYPSVEDELSTVFSRRAQSGKCTLHASGREDVDVRCLGTGRPFVLEITGAKKRALDFPAIEAEFASNPNVQAVRLRAVPKHFLDAVCNSHFEKKYVATISAGRPLSQLDARKAESLSGKTLFQETPSRVLARRADLVRRRKVVSLKAEAADGGKLRLEILAEAGTYIKEMISSDGGRTKPSISALLSCAARCDELDVIEIQDYFLETLAD